MAEDRAQAAIEAPPPNPLAQLLEEALEEKRRFEQSSSLAWAQIVKLANSDQGGWREAGAKIFQSIDKDGNGKIDISELASGLQNFGINMSSAQLVHFRDDLDENGDGTVSLDEFKVALFVRLRSTYAEASSFDSDTVARSVEFAWNVVLDAAARSDPVEWRRMCEQMFVSFDTDHNGLLDADELAAGLASMGCHLSDEAAAAFRDECDEDLNGEISLSEFLMALKQRQVNDYVHGELCPCI